MQALRLFPFVYDRASQIPRVLRRAAPGSGAVWFLQTQPVKDTGNDRWLRQHRGVTPPREEIREWPAMHLPAISVIQS